MVHLQKIETAFVDDRRPDTMLYQKKFSQSLETCPFHLFAIFSNCSRGQSWTAQSHKFERTPFADYPDYIRLKSIRCFLRYWHFGKTVLVNRE